MGWSRLRRFRLLERRVLAAVAVVLGGLWPAAGCVPEAPSVPGPARARADASEAGAALSRAAGDRILHEQLPNVRGDEVDLILGADPPTPRGALGARGGRGAGADGSSSADGEVASGGGVGDGDEGAPGPTSSPPPSLLYQGAVLSVPEGDAPLDGAQEVPMSAVPGDGRAGEAPGRRSPTFRPDRQTELEGTLGYYASFNPTVAPFKRVTAFDAVAVEPDGTPVLVVADADAVERLPVVAPSAGADEPRDRFWGSVVLDFSEGSRVPLPTPGPDARILWWSAAPSLPLAFERDSAENAFARLLPEASRGADGDGAGAGGAPTTVRLTFLVDVPRAYFGGGIPDVANDTLGSLVPELPLELAERARRVAEELGVRRGDPLKGSLDRLVAHFRAFEESADPPEDTGDVFVDLALGGKGICRHRSYAFVITALALGIPSRFAMNEAHSWVEVALPGRGWLRVDLGGAAAGLEARGAEDRVLHRPGEPDTLPKPPAYLRSYSQLSGDVQGLPEGPIDPRRPGPAAATGAGDARQTAGAGSTDATSTRAAPSPPPRPSAAPWGRRGGRRGAVRLSADATAYTAFRGRNLTVTGRATNDDGTGIPGLRVEALLRAPGTQRLLGVTVTDAHGYFRGDFGVPPELAAGTYELGLRFPGDATWSPAEL